jgi:hypothetical protein
MYAFRFNDYTIIEIEKITTTDWCCGTQTEYVCYKTTIIDGVPQERESIRLKQREYDTLVMLHRMNNNKDAEQYVNRWILNRFYSLDVMEDDDDEVIELSIM